MSSALLADAADLIAWAGRLDARARLPELVRRLVHATLGPSEIVSINMPSAEAIQLPGVDGRTVVRSGNAFVPSGVCAWEMSTQDPPTTKAESDYRKRTVKKPAVDHTQEAFVSVTARRWPGKAKWAAERAAEGAWREVRAYDVDDLVQWLETAAGVHHWLSRLLGKVPTDVVDISDRWLDWASVTDPPVSEELLLAGRSVLVERLAKCSLERPTTFELQAGTKEEAIALIAASLRSLSEPMRAQFLARTLVVRNLDAWKQLVHSKQVLVLVQDFDDAEAASIATRKGHLALVPLDRESTTSPATIETPPLDVASATQALVKAGVTEAEALESARLMRRSLPSFRRARASSSAGRRPAWADSVEGPKLLPALFAGAWNDGCAADKAAMAALNPNGYEGFMESAHRWVRDGDPPLRNVGSAWHLTSKEDAWVLLENHLTAASLERFERVALEVLGSPNPVFDLPPEERWSAGPRDPASRCSELLTRGIAETLAIMGSRSVRVGSTPHSTGDYAARIVRVLLGRAITDWRIWATLSNELRSLAEASPDEFLHALEEGTRRGSAVIGHLFTDSSDAIFSASPHVGLVFALETIAWSPEHLTRVALVLGRLAELDPGGKVSNRPENTLRELFLLWHPNTAANLDGRLSALDALLLRRPIVGWRLLCRLLPQGHSTGHNTCTPRWRDWASGHRSGVTTAEYLRGIREVTTRSLTHAGISGERWRQILAALGQFPPEQHREVVAGLKSLDVGTLSDEARRAVGETLRSIVSRHRSYSNADWAMPADYVDELAELCGQFEPVSLAHRHAWLFEGMPELLEGERDDYQAHERRVHELRLAAVGQVAQASGVQGLSSLAENSAGPFAVGFVAGQGDFIGAEENATLIGSLCANDAWRGQFARGIVAGSFAARGEQWAQSRIADLESAWSPEQAGEFLMCLPCESATWSNAERLGIEVDRAYWKRVHTYRLVNTADVEACVQKLLEHARPFAAIEALAVGIQRKASLTSEFIADALERSIAVESKDTPGLSSFGHWVSKLLEHLEQSGSIDGARMAKIEWALLPVLEKPPKFLHQELARSPEFFVEVVSLVWRVSNEVAVEGTPQHAERAARAWKLLHHWRRLPGSDASGTADPAALRAWVKSARERLAARGRAETGDYQIGEALSSAPQGSDGVWPLEVVRDVLEECDSTNMEQGLVLGLLNSRGVRSRSMTDAGSAERRQAEECRQQAATVAARWPRTAVVLGELARHYDSESQWDVQDAELRDVLYP